MIAIQVKLIPNTDEERFTYVMVNNPSDIPTFIDFGTGEAFVFSNLETVITEKDKGIEVSSYPVYIRDSRTAKLFISDFHRLCTTEESK